MPQGSNVRPVDVMPFLLFVLRKGRRDVFDVFFFRSSVRVARYLSFGRLAGRVADHYSVLATYSRGPPKCRLLLLSFGLYCCLFRPRSAVDRAIRCCHVLVYRSIGAWNFTVRVLWCSMFDHLPCALPFGLANVGLIAVLARHSVDDV